MKQVRQRKTWDPLYVELKKMIQINLFTKKKQTHRHRKQTYGYQTEKVGKHIKNLGIADTHY